jgi:hypothetical protein
MLLDEIKAIRTDVFDIKNRVRIIMDKVTASDKNIDNTKINNFKKNFELNNKIDLQIFENNNENKNENNNNLDFEQNNNFNINNETTIKKKDKKNIKIIMANGDKKNKSTNNNLSYNNFSDDNISDFNNDELDRELKKILC